MSDEMNDYTKDEEAWIPEDGYDDEEDESPPPEPNEGSDLEHGSDVGC